jgi:lysophospholipase L1-like esterase
VLWKRLRGRPIFAFDQRVDFYLAWKDHGWANAHRLIGEMYGMLASRGVPLYIVVFPVVDQVDERYRRLDADYVLSPQRRIRRISDEYEIPLIDLTEPLRARGGPRLFRDYVHLNGEGNDIVADQLEAFLVERGH